MSLGRLSNGMRWSGLLMKKCSMRIGARFVRKWRNLCSRQTGDTEKRACPKVNAQVGEVNLVKSLVLLLIQGYRATKSWRLPRCRFYPSCSAYAFTAIDRHGLLPGFWLTAVRLVKCQPLHPGGVDEVPSAEEVHRWYAHMGESCRALWFSFYHREQT